MLKLELSAPSGFLFCVICQAYHNPRWHEITWRERHKDDLEALAMYSKAPRQDNA